MPHGYTNRTMRNGPVVIKTYQGLEAGRRCTREAAVLRALAGRLPVPEVIDSGEGCLTLSLMEGVPGQDLIDAGLADPVLRACGRTLRRIQAIDPALAHVEGHGARPAVLVHGDFGPNNALLDLAAQQITAIVDWEWAHAGHPVEDLAWCEWIVRMHHPADVGALGALFEGYGSAPAWSARHQAMLAQCRVQLDLSEQWQPGGENTRRWQQRLAVTQAWTE